MNDIDRLVRLNEQDDQRDRSATRFFKGLLFVSLSICVLVILLAVGFASFVIGVMVRMVNSSEQ
jgi:hypothetical protein